ncbi:MAG: 3-hydroxyacyl-ACP dehydratase FabZ [Paracoccaceae bacterium]
MPNDISTTETHSADITEIMRLIPHRYPFLLIDAVKDIRLAEYAVGVKMVTMNEPYFQGHFPGKPIMPGVLIVEALAQTSAVLVSKTLNLIDTGVMVYFMTMDKTKFRQMVTPGDALELHVTTIRQRRKIWKFLGEAKVDGKTVAECEFSAMIAMPDDADKS